jgi:hypothetical protein
MKNIQKFENYTNREEMIEMLCKLGCDRTELETIPDSELEQKLMQMNSFEESKKDNWIKDVVKNNAGALKKSLKKKEGDKINPKEIDTELQALKGKDKDKSKEGIQGLSKKDLKKYRQLTLAKNLMKNENHNQGTDNYMFFTNLENICRMVSEMLEMDKDEIDSMLTNGHDWAADHASKANEIVSHVYNWLKTEDSEENTEVKTNGNIKKFGDF